MSTEYRVDGMSCGHCEGAVREEVGKLDGVRVLEVDAGTGRLLVDAIFARDYPVIQGCLLFIAGIYVLVNLVVDLLYPIFDPRVTAQ